jgi:hypothetical protein
MIVLFTFEYGAKITPEEAAILKPLLRGNPDIPMPKEDDKSGYVWYSEYAGDLREIAKACPRVVPHIKLKNAELDVTAFEHIMGTLAKLAEKVESVPVLPADRAYNEKVSVHVPGLGLLLIDEVEVLYDCCTTKLQDHLEKGWRIIAACPQPDQRRPDYIIGRHKNES